MKDSLSMIVSEFGKAFAQQLFKTTEQVQVVNKQVVAKETPDVSTTQPVIEIAKTQKVDGKFTHEDYEKLKPYLKYDETYEEVLNTERLYLGNTCISDLTPLQNLVNLRYLDLYKNNFSDLTPLKDLIKLKELILYNNKISNIEPLKNLVNLKRMWLHKDDISQNQINELQTCLPNCEIIFYDGID